MYTYYIYILHCVALCQAKCLQSREHVMRYSTLAKRSGGQAQTPRTPRTTPSLQAAAMAFLLVAASFLYTACCFLLEEDRRFQEVVAYIKDNTLKNPESMLYSLHRSSSSRSFLFMPFSTQKNLTR